MGEQMRHAAMVAAAGEEGGAPLLRTRFWLDPGHGPVVSAILRATALGVYQASLNGEPVGDDVLSPGWSSYEWRLRYRSYDVTGRLDRDNVLGLALGNGWYRGRLGWLGGRALYGDRLAALAELEISFEDGHRQFVGTDSGWLSAPSETVANDLYDGQVIDARRRRPGWDTPAYDAGGWGVVEVLPFDHRRLVPAVAAPVTRHESRRPQRIWTSPGGRTLVDFGQNLVGWLRFRVQGPAGQVVTIRHAEVLEDGELGVRPLRSARATDRLVLSGDLDHFEPTFTFHGFRYAEIDGWPGPLTEDSIEAVVVHSALRRTGHFACSDELLNQLHRNVVWSLRGNFLAVPTDCPQRDERLGWTGDLAVFAPTAAYLYDVQDFLTDWLADLAAEQSATGFVPIVVPDSLKRQPDAPPPAGFELSPVTAIWGDAAVWVPWAMWEAYGNSSILARQFDSMIAHVRSAAALLSETGVWDGDAQFGDWLDPDSPPRRPAGSKADPGVVSTAALYRSATSVAAAAEVLGRDDDAAEMGCLGSRLRAAFAQAYVQGDGTITSDCATVYALAIAFGLLDGDRRQAAGDRLAEIVAAAGYHVSTGFAGTPYVTGALSDTGHVEAAYRLLLETSCPSWLYPVTMGATTTWERWDSMLPDGTINPGEMTSFNHYALGAVATWMHRVIAGVSPLTPGYRTVRIAPQPGGGLTWARCSLETPQGPLRVEWEIVDEVAEQKVAKLVELHVDLPAGTSAEVTVPGAEPVWLPGGRHALRGPLPATRYETADRG